MEMSLGLNHVPEGPLSSPCFLNHLRGTLVDIISFDWMHCFLVSGLWNSEMGLLLQALKEHANIRPSDCHEFLSQFSWPNAQQGRGTTGRNVLKKHTEGELKCSASEGLSLYPIIRHMLAELVGNHPEPIVQGAIASYYSLADVLDLLVKNRLEQDISPVTLQTAITKYLQLRVGVYGPEHLPPKGHFINHLPFVLEKNPVLACWVHERKHRELKRLANNFTNANKTLSFENGLLRSAVLSQMHSIETLQVERGLELDSSRASQRHSAGARHPFSGFGHWDQSTCVHGSVCQPFHKMLRKRRSFHRNRSWGDLVSCECGWKAFELLFPLGAHGRQ